MWNAGAILAWRRPLRAGDGRIVQWYGEGTGDLVTATDGRDLMRAA